LTDAGKDGSQHGDGDEESAAGKGGSHEESTAADDIAASTAAIPSEASPAAVVDVAGNPPNHTPAFFSEAQSATARGSTHGASDSRATRLKCSHGNVFNSKRRVASGTAAVEQFVMANLVGDNDFCLAMLEHLGRDDDEVPECAETQLELQRMLHNRCFALFNFYNNIGFMKLYDDAVAALCGYGGKERPFDAKLLLKLLSQYAFVVTPRMWTKTEILCIMILLLDPSLHYFSINQKKGLEADQNR
jgi:hypothetical protein